MFRRLLDTNNTTDTKYTCFNAYWIQIIQLIPNIHVKQRLWLDLLNLFFFHTFCEFKKYMYLLFFKKENGRIRPLEETAILVLIGPHPDDLLNFSKWYSSCQRLVSLNCWPVYTGLSSKDASLKTTRKTSKMTIPRLDKGFFIEFHWVSFIGFWNDLAKKETCLHLHEIMNMRK